MLLLLLFAVTVGFTACTVYNVHGSTSYWRICDLNHSDKAISNVICLFYISSEGYTYPYHIVSISYASEHALLAISNASATSNWQDNWMKLYLTRTRERRNVKIKGSAWHGATLVAKPTEGVYRQWTNLFGNILISLCSGLVWLTATRAYGNWVAQFMCFTNIPLFKWGSDFGCSRLERIGTTKIASYIRRFCTVWFCARWMGRRWGKLLIVDVDMCLHENRNLCIKTKKSMPGIFFENSLLFERVKRTLSRDHRLSKQRDSTMHDRKKVKYYVRCAWMKSEYDPIKSASRTSQLFDNSLHPRSKMNLLLYMLETIFVCFSPLFQLQFFISLFMRLCFAE